MILIKTPSFLAVSEDRQTAKKVSKLVVNYQHTLGTKEVEGKTVQQGYIGSWLFEDAEGTNIMGEQMVQEDNEFKGKDILGMLHSQYIEVLKALNPTIKFTDTYNN